MGTVKEYKARNAARDTRKAEKQKPPEKQPWWFNQPNPIDRFTGWLVAWTALLFIASIFNAMILHWTDEKIGKQAKTATEQLVAMQGQLREMESTGKQTQELIDSNKKLAEAAIRQAEAAISAANTAKETLGAQKEASERQLRAYVYMDKAMATIVNDKTVRAAIEFKNSGQTPAYDLSTKTQLAVDEAGKRFVPTAFKDDLSLSKGIMGPGGVLTVFVELDLSTIGIQALQNNRSAIHMNAEVQYKDAFGKICTLAVFLRNGHFDGARWVMNVSTERETAESCNTKNSR